MSFHASGDNFIVLQVNHCCYDTESVALVVRVCKLELFCSILAFHSFMCSSDQLRCASSENSICCILFELDLYFIFMCGVCSHNFKKNNTNFKKSFYWYFFLNQFLHISCNPIWNSRKSKSHFPYINQVQTYNKIGLKMTLLMFF